MLQVRETEILLRTCSGGIAQVRSCAPQREHSSLVQGSANSGSRPKFGRETFHSVSRNNLNLHFKFAILIRQKKYGHLGLLFHVLSFIQFCARKLLLPIVGLVLKFIFNYRAFSTKLYAHEMFGSREF